MRNILTLTMLIFMTASAHAEAPANALPTPQDYAKATAHLTRSYMQAQGMCGQVPPAARAGQIVVFYDADCKAHVVVGKKEK